MADSVITEIRVKGAGILCCLPWDRILPEMPWLRIQHYRSTSLRQRGISWGLRFLRFWEKTFWKNNFNTADEEARRICHSRTVPFQWFVCTNSGNIHYYFS